MSPTQKLDLITNTIAELYQITADDLRANRRLKEFARPRQILYWCALRIGLKTVETGQYLGGRNHATVIFGCQNAHDRMTVDMAYLTEVKTVISTLESVNPIFTHLHSELPALHRNRWLATKLAKTFGGISQDLPISHLKFSNGQ